MNEILAKNEEWLTALAEVTNELTGKNFMTPYEQLLALFEDDNNEAEILWKKLKKEKALQTVLAGLDYNSAHLTNPTLFDAVNLCEAIWKNMPPSLSNSFDFSKIQKQKYNFAARGEIAIFQVVQGLNATIVELQVQTDDTSLPEDFFYWNKDKIYVISFVEELDDEHRIAQANYLHRV